MAVDASNQNFQAPGKRIVAFFRAKEDAYRAVAELKKAGFTSDEIGLMARSDRQTGTTTGSVERNESMWDKVKHFFSDDSSEEDLDYRDSAAGLNWDESRGDYYYHGLQQGGAVVSVAGPRAQQARSILENAGGDLREKGFETTQATGSPDVGAIEQGYRIQLRGEVLHTFRDRVQRGEVRLRKEVVTENQTIDVPVTREELVVERVPVSGEQDANAGQIGSDQEIRVPLSEERARVEKRPVVNEEVRVGKRAVQDTEMVSDKVRHEKLRVDKEGDVEVDTRTTGKAKKPAA